MHRFRFLRTEPEKTVPTYTGYDVYLGVDVYRPGLGRMFRGLAERKLENVRILCGDAASVIEYQVSDRKPRRCAILSSVKS